VEERKRVGEAVRGVLGGEEWMIDRLLTL
jgi:hypothetical protein